MAKKIMFQGTASSVGKSILTTALCRIFAEDGHRVVPFKSQNMALNSFVTRDGREMGRAQVVQAEAARITPSVDMNPILLKPTSDIGSQVILNGLVYKNMKADEYQKIKSCLKGVVKAAYDRLEASYDMIIIEGAGSPAEINLRENDLVNMGLAELIDAPVILIGDIDRGGVFASIYGTVMLMDGDERGRIKGFIINKFRGDVEILNSGIKMLEEKINIPCLGIIPYMDINIDDEDSVTDRFTGTDEGELRVGIIKTPYISNFSDFTPLEMDESISLRYITRKEELTDIDLIVLPGSKNTIKDLQYIYNTGIDQAIYRNHRNGVPIIGICGGYQMLGYEVSDPNLEESNLKSINGLSLLETKTTILKDKRTEQIGGKLIPHGSSWLNTLENLSVKGYEIHMGDTELIGKDKPLIALADGRMDGGISDDGRVLGTYLHGIFENDNFRNHIISMLKEKKGLKSKSKYLSYKELKEKEYDKLAHIVKENIDMCKIHKIMGI